MYAIRSYYVISEDKWCAYVNNEEYPINKNDFSFSVHHEIIKIDCAYITIHGAPGENGELQGYFNMLNIPYTTCDVPAASISFNKFTCNTYLKGFGVAVADSVLIRKGSTYNTADIIEQVGLPCFVKPNAGGSSFGISKVKEREDLASAIEKAFSESKEVIIEQFVGGTEVTCGVIKTKDDTILLPLTEVISHNEFFDYSAKYEGEVEEITPARVKDEVRDRIHSISSLVYDILGCKGIIRIDYIISENKIFMLEVNRITSYNVCYTKLLRFLNRQLPMASVIRFHGARCSYFRLLSKQFVLTA